MELLKGAEARKNRWLESRDARADLRKVGRARARVRTCPLRPPPASTANRVPPLPTVIAADKIQDKMQDHNTGRRWRVDDDTRWCLEDTLSL